MTRRTPLPPAEPVLMDNRRVDVLSAGREHLLYAIALLSNGQTVTHVMHDEGDLVLLSCPAPNAIPVTHLETVEQITNYVENWLTTQAEYQGHFDDADVINERTGFRAWCGQWGQDTKIPAGFARIQARWAWRGK